MADESFSFRWGISMLDDGDTRIPNFILDNYTAAGVSRSEFLAIVHLARYQYEKAGSECRPSVGSVACQMGYTRRALRKILAGLEKRELLRRHYRTGETTIYDFTGFSRAVMAVWLSTGEEPQDLPKKVREELQDLGGEELGDLGGRNGRTSKEEHKEQHPKRSGGGPAEEEEHVLSLLVDFGVNEAVAHKLAAQCTPDQVQGWIAYADGARGVRDPAALVVARLQAGEPAPAARQEPGGKTALVCPECSLVRPVQFICPECGCCYDCCECEEGSGDE